MVISLFEEIKFAHKHVTCEDDIREELLGLLKEAGTAYYEKVVKGGMKPMIFAELFCESHRHIDCNETRCMNAHAMNVSIVRSLLTVGRALFRKFAGRTPLTEKECLEMINRHLFISRPMNAKEEESPTLSSKLSASQEENLAGIVHSYGLFELPEGMDERTAVTKLLHCEEGFAVKVRNLRNVAVMFDELLAMKLICYKWQHRLVEGKHLISSQSEECVTTSSLSSALSESKKSPTLQQERIRSDVKNKLGK